MRDVLKKNGLGLALLGVAVVFAAVCVGCGGVSLADLVRVSVPLEVQRATSAPAVVSLADAPAVWEKWELAVRQGSERFGDNVRRASALYSFVGSAINMGVGELGAAGALAAVPGGALALSLVTGAAGLFLRRPGTQREVDGAYDLGAKEAIEKARAGVEMVLKSGEKLRV
jgi:hypothetical protein